MITPKAEVPIFYEKCRYSEEMTSAAPISIAPYVSHKLPRL